MNRAPSRKFAGWAISAAGAVCDACDTTVAFPLSASLPDFLDALLDHDWSHDPLAVTAPLEAIDNWTHR